MTHSRLILSASALAILASCGVVDRARDGFANATDIARDTGQRTADSATGADGDLRGLAGGFTTAGATRAVVEARPQPDSRGVISYPTYQVALARGGETVTQMAARLGMDGAALARTNGLLPNQPLRAGELVVLPKRVAEPSPATGATTSGPIKPTATPSVTVSGLDDDGNAPSSGAEPTRHTVTSGETAFSISRKYGVPVDKLAEWNGLGPDRIVRVGSTLLIPPKAGGTPPAAEVAKPGEQSAAPTPPSAAQPLPENEAPASEDAAETPPAPDLAASATSASDTAKMLTPVAGRIISRYSKGSNDGIDIAASAGTAVKAADAGTVAAVTRDTDGVPIVVVRHANNVLTVYAGVDDLSVAKGDSVSRGQQIAKVRAGDPAALHFEVRNGFESVDPTTYIN